MKKKFILLAMFLSLSFIFIGCGVDNFQGPNMLDNELDSMPSSGCFTFDVVGGSMIADGYIIYEGDNDYSNIDANCSCITAPIGTTPAAITLRSASGDYPCEISVIDVEFESPSDKKITVLAEYSNLPGPMEYTVEMEGFLGILDADSNLIAKVNLGNAYENADEKQKISITETYDPNDSTNSDQTNPAEDGNAEEAANTTNPVETTTGPAIVVGNYEAKPDASGGSPVKNTGNEIDYYVERTKSQTEISAAPAVPADPEPAWRESADKKFIDVNESDFFSAAVGWASEKDVVFGIDEQHFDPNGGCTRAQMVTFLWRAAGKPEPVSTDTEFSDLDEDAYYYEAVLWANENEITKGTTETTFSPKWVVSRAQTVVFLARLAGVSDKANGFEQNFEDVSDNDYFSNAVAWASENGITNGIDSEGTMFGPDADCLRSQIVTFLYNYFGKQQ